MQDNAFIEELFFCDYVKGRCTAQELFDIIDNNVSKNNLDWKNCHGVCTDGKKKKGKLYLFLSINWRGVLCINATHVAARAAPKAG